MQCQIHIQKGQLFFKSACQVHHSPECGFENGWRERRREKPETDRGGRSRRPVDIPAHLSDSHLPQRVNVPTALCLLHGRLAAPPLLVQSCIGALCLHWASGTHQSPQGSWRDRSASVCEAELWLYWWTVLPPRQPTTAWSAAGSRGGGRNAASAKVFLCTVPAALLCCLSVCLSVWLSVCLSVWVSGDESDFRTVLPLGRLCWFCLIVITEGQMNPWGLLFETDRSVSELLVLFMLWWLCLLYINVLERKLK